MAAFSCCLPVNAGADSLWGLVSDVERVASIFPFLSVDRVSSPEPSCWEFRRTLAIPSIVNLSWTERARVVAERELAFHAVEGDLREFNGSWIVCPQETGSTLSLELKYAIPPGVGPKLPAPMVTYAMNELFNTVCRKIKEAAEGGNA